MTVARKIRRTKISLITTMILVAIAVVLGVVSILHGTDKMVMAFIGASSFGVASTMVSLSLYTSTSVEITNEKLEEN